MERNEVERHAPQGRARTMTDEQEREDRATRYWAVNLNDRVTMVLFDVRERAYAELDAERAAHAETKAALHEHDRETVYVGSTARTITAMIERIVLAGEDAEEVVNDYGWEWKRGPDLSPLVALKARLALAEAVESALGAFLNRAEFFRGRSEWRETLAKADNALAAWRAAK